MSHRSDIFGPEITSRLEKLRDSAPPHSMKETAKEFERAFGMKIADVFEQFDPVPIASGSIAQVHKAILNGQPVAVKVRHPNIEHKLEMDIKILFSFSNFFSRTLGILKSASMPVTIEEFKRTLLSQNDLRFEAKNLTLFTQRFGMHSQIFFPQPIQPYISEGVLTETWEDGLPLQKFIELKHSSEHDTVANLALKTAYKMVIYDNFIHADCHAGNILIRYKQQEDEEGILQKFKAQVNRLEDNIYAIGEDVIDFLVTKWDEWESGKLQSVGWKLRKEINFDEKQFAAS